MSYKSPDSSAMHRKNREVENVLILQGGGSLGAFSCGVFKALFKEQIKMDIIAGTSIGAINAAIIAVVRMDILKSIWKTFGWNWQKALLT